MNTIPLQKRIDALNRGYVSDMEYMIVQEKKWAQMPIKEYLKDFPDVADRIMEYFSDYDDRLEDMTYQEVAVRIEQMIKGKENAEITKKLLEMLAIPIKQLYRVRVMS